MSIRMNIMKYRSLLVILIGLSLSVAHAGTITVTTNKNWSALPSTPTSSDSIIVKNNATLTVNVTNAVCKAIQLGDNTGGGSKGTGKLTFTSDAGSKVTISGRIYLGDGSKTGTLTMVSGATLICQGITRSSTASYGNENGTIELTATNTLPSATVSSFDTLIISGSTTMGRNLTIEGKLILNDDLAINGKTLKLSGDFSGSSSNTLIGSSTSDLTVNGSGTIGTLYFDQTTDGTSNKIATFTVNRSGETVKIGNNLHIATSLTLTAGKFDLNDQTLTLASANITNDSVDCLVGSNASNLTISGSGSINTLYFDQTSASDTSLGTLTINRSGVTVTLGSKLKIITALVPTAGTLSTGGKLILESDSAGTARIESGSCTTCSYISGNVTVRRYIPSVGRRWRFLSSTISNTTLNDWKGETYVTGTGGAGNGFDATSSNAPSVYWYNETVTTGDLNTGWTSAAATTDSLTPGKGYRVFIRGDRSDDGRLTGSVSTQNAVTLDLVGTVNMGNVNLNPTFTASGDTANDGWNLVGNPYACPVDWNAFHDAGRSGSSNDYSGTDYAHLYPIAYIFDASTNSYVSYNAVTNAGTGSFNSGIIPAGAAFFVKAPASSPTMTMKETYKSTGTPGGMYKTVTTPQYFSIRLIQDAITSDEMVVIYKDQATPNKDVYDINKLYGSDVNIAGIAADGSYQSLVCKPFNNAGDSIPLSVGVRRTGDYAFTFKNADKLIADPHYYLELVDLKELTVTNLLYYPTYPFHVDLSDTNTYGNHRFYLRTARTHLEGLSNLAKSSGNHLLLLPTATHDYSQILSGVKVNGQASVTITDISGKMVVSHKQEWNNNRLNIDLSDFKQGVYFISVSDGGPLSGTVKCVKY